MNKKGNPRTLVAAHPGNLNAVKSGAHSPRLLNARAAEIVEELALGDDLDQAGHIALGEVARLSALIEAIDRDLDQRGLTDKDGQERYLLQRRERYSRRLLDAHDRLLDAVTRTKREKASRSSNTVTGTAADYVRHLQTIAFGHEPDARVSDRVVALKLLLDLGAKGDSSYYEQRPLRYADDPEINALRARVEAAEREGYIANLRNEMELKRFTG